MAYKRYRSEKKRNQRRRLRKERADRIQRKFEEVLRTIYEVSTPACHGAQPATIKSSESSTKPIRTRSGRIVRPPIRWQAPCTSKRPPRKRRRNVKRQTPKITYPFPTVQCVTPTGEEFVHIIIQFMFISFFLQFCIDHQTALFIIKQLKTQTE